MRRFSTRATPPNSPPLISKAASTSASAANMPPGPAPSSIAKTPSSSSPSPGREKESAVRLGRIGFDHIVGYFRDGLRSLDSRPDFVTTTESFSPQYALQAMAGSRSGVDSNGRAADSDSPFVIDVRNPGERARKYIDNSRKHPARIISSRKRQTCHTTVTYSSTAPAATAPPSPPASSNAPVSQKSPKSPAASPPGNPPTYRFELRR